MNASLLREYRRQRRAGHNAAHALDAARTVLRFGRLEALGLVRVVARPDLHHDWSDEPPGVVERYGDDGAWGTVGQYTLDPENASTDEGRDEGWEDADSCWGHVGYRDVLSPHENWYVLDIMAQTIRELRKALKSRCPTCRRPLPHAR